ncbi:diaminopimelate epimerase [Renibacterium salmoninarum ATCC 33209]|uniref:Diaminopimelate epimerase n=1 Tax=Renibacterium salmoninarum (strain ATCC 33209 / DSM 20767 / JCM 11484 / NBRC 15589 / NCIMB 2235) TaxID=288705 RepID=A9WQ49_RENSM|nr:diaminopimelate epimerase [Renibacterium salmoninarum]ABY22475.1 diaminopimelate epimerase [Renibacterium salmoninarum ATCC 33209]
MTSTALHRLTGVSFSKGHGTGNDFILIADPDGVHDIDEATVVAACDRHRGIGADGFIRAIKSRELAEGTAVLDANPHAEWFMDYRNADGSISEMCGNGVRVFVQFLLESELVWLEPGQILPIGTRDGVKLVRRTAAGFSVDMGQWKFTMPQTAEDRGVDSLVTANGLDVARPALSINTGNAHTLVALAHRAELDELDLHRAPIVDPVPEHGSNVEFALPHDPLVVGGIAEISMRVFERGVGETLSCGTGACAAAAATRFWAGEGAPAEWKINVPGGSVVAKFFVAEDQTEHVELSGPAVIVARGVFS